MGPVVHVAAWLVVLAVLLGAEAAALFGLAYASLLLTGGIPHLLLDVLLLPGMVLNGWALTVLPPRLADSAVHRMRGEPPEPTTGEDPDA